MAKSAHWLKSMENGGLGEARAKAFLMNRFWVLERSVDIEGADFLVQRKLTDQNLMDHGPLLLGRVQVKFIQDGGTSISVPKDYLCDSKGNPYNEFFLLIFTGHEDDERGYLLSSTDIFHEFSERLDGNRILLWIRGSKLMETSNYEVVQSKRALDRIEHALAIADFVSNRRFLIGTNFVKITPDHIDEDLLAPLGNQYGNFREVFFEEKKKLRSTLFDIEHVIEAMQEMLHTTDPEDAFCLYEDVLKQYISGVSGSRNISFSCDFFNDKDFLDAVKKHKARLAKLRELGVESNYFKLLDLFEKTIVEKLGHPEFDLSTKSVCVQVNYDSETLRNGRVVIEVADTDQPKPFIASSRRGEQIVVYDVKDSAPIRALDEIEDAEARIKFLRKRIWLFRRPFQTALDTLLLGDDLLASQ